MPANENRGLMGMVPRPGNWRDWRQAFDVLSNPWLHGDWYNSNEGRWNNPAEAFGLDRALGGIMGLFNRAGQPANEFLRGTGQPDGSGEYTGPGSPGWVPTPFDAEATRPGPRLPMSSRGGNGRGGSAGSRVVMTGDAARSAVEGMRDGQRQAQMEAEAAAWRRRAASTPQ